MEIVYIVIALLLAIILSDILNEIFDKIPAIFIEILIGVALSFTPFFKEFELEPELFMLIIIKPLIFNEAQRLSIDELKEHFKPIISLSLFLVIFSIVVIGFLVSMLDREIPLSTTFILVAILIPTNASIVEAICEHLKFPEYVFGILEEESLFNDSIAIVIAEIALATSLTQKFNLVESISEFVYIILGGVIVGSILGFIIIKIRYSITKNDLENPSMMVVMQIITPFIVYMISEEYLHVSGIIAVIMSGIIHGIERKLLNLKSTRLQVISNSTWEVIGYVLDGIVAVFLGLILPTIVKNILFYDLSKFINLIFISVFVYLLLIVIRFFWVYLQSSYFFIKLEEKEHKIKYSILYALSGVRGTITLVIALSLPEENELLFRNELIFIAGVVILISITIPSIVFPFILSRSISEVREAEFERARKEMLEYTISEIENSSKNKNDRDINETIKILRGQLNFIENGELLRPNRDEVKKIINQANKIEINIVDSKFGKGEISKELAFFYKLYISRSSEFGLKGKLSKLRMRYIKNKIRKSSRINEAYKDKFINSFKSLRHESCKAAMDYLNNIKNNSNYRDVDFVINYYKKRLGKDISELYENEMTESMQRQLIKMFEIESIFVKDYLEKEKISPELAKELREQIYYDELVYLK